MSEFHEGDLVEAVKGETVIRGRAIPHFTGKLAPGECTASLSWYEANGFTVTVIEKAAPSALPEYTVIERVDGTVYVSNGNDYFNAYGNFSPAAATLGGYKIVAEPVPVTAARVLDDVIARTTMHCNACAGHLVDIRKEYGAAL